MVNYLYKLMGSEAEITEKICCLLVTKIYLEKLLWKIAQIAEIIFYLQQVKISGNIYEIIGGKNWKKQQTQSNIQVTEKYTVRCTKKLLKTSAV